MIAVAVMAILVAMAFPSFSSTMRSNQIATRANEFMASVSLARLEAIRANTGGGVCATSDNGVSCGVDWNSGWMVFDDNNGNGTFDGGDTVKRVSDGNSHMAMTAVVGGGTLAFNSRGIYRGAVAANFSMTPTDCAPGYLGVRGFTLLPSGQLIMSKVACP